MSIRHLPQIDTSLDRNKPTPEIQLTYDVRADYANALSNRKTGKTLFDIFVEVTKMKKSKTSVRAITSMSPQEQEDTILREWNKLNSPAFDRFINHAAQMGARLFVRFKDGRELELPLPSISSSTQTNTEK